MFLFLLSAAAAWAADEWKPLFDGKTSAGWVEITGKPFPDTWTIEDGCLKTVLPPGRDAGHPHGGSVPRV